DSFQVGIIIEIFAIILIQFKFTFETSMAYLNDVLENKISKTKKNTKDKNTVREKSFSQDYNRTYG
ncbi:MAG: hypothetical protein Q3961_04020, partial [Bifidobacteriaceae bacterium]|nr:hypothetical protein [Bifidobacteriaceae bacterium]